MSSVIGLLAPSGSGKSTLLRAIVGVQRIAGGPVTVLGATAGSAVLRTRVDRDLLVEGTPASLRQRTGADDLDDAFLRLIQRVGECASTA